VLAIAFSFTGIFLKYSGPRIRISGNAWRSVFHVDGVHLDETVACIRDIKRGVDVAGNGKYATDMVALQSWAFVGKIKLKIDIVIVVTDGGGDFPACDVPGISG
jgi:hypothetical protein